MENAKIEAVCREAAGYAEYSPEQIDEWIGGMLLAMSAGAIPPDAFVSKLVGMVWNQSRALPSDMSDEQWVGLAAALEPIDGEPFELLHYDGFWLLGSDPTRIHRAMVLEPQWDGASPAAHLVHPDELRVIESSTPYNPAALELGRDFGKYRSEVTVTLESFVPISKDVVRYGGACYDRRFVIAAFGGAETMATQTTIDDRNGPIVLRSIDGAREAMIAAIAAADR